MITRFFRSSTVWLKKTAIEWGLFYLIFVVVCVPRLTYYTTNTGASDGAQKNEYQFNKFA